MPERDRPALAPASGSPRVSADTLALALLSASAMVMACGYALDLAGLPMYPRALAAVWIVCLALGISGFRQHSIDMEGPAGASRERGVLAAFAFVVAAVGAYFLWLASPSFLPVTIGPDVVHHLQLIHLIQRTHRLVHDAELQPYLLEMVNYTPGSHIMAAMVGEWFGTDALRVLQPVTAACTAMKMGVLYLLAVRALPRSPSAPVAALAAPILAFIPAEYTIGSSFHFFFYAQVVSEAFATGMLLATLLWIGSERPACLVAFSLCGVGVFLAWPVWLGPACAPLLVSLAFRSSARGRLRPACIAFAPIVLAAAVHSMLHAEGGRILGSAGAVTAPSVAGFGPAFLIGAAAGVAIVVLRVRAALPIVVFLGVTLLQALTLAALEMHGGSSSLYMPFKMMYLAVLPAAALGGIAMIWAADVASTGLARIGRGLRLVPLALAIILAVGRVPHVRPRSPITASAYAAGVWARDHVQPSCVDYFSSHWLTGYWLHLDVLGNPRDSARMREETFEFRDVAGRWLEGRGMPYAIVDDVSILPRELRPEFTVLHAIGHTAVLRNLRPRACP